jgi:hypothetical protein
MNYRLTDATEMAIKHPETFEAPSFEEIQNLEVGNWAKLCFENPDEKRRIGSERMWVKVTGILKENEVTKIHGYLDNDPVVVDLKHGEKIIFEPKHIYSIMED